MTGFNPLLYNEKYRIHTNRLTNRGYGVGFYHVVVCTKDRRYYFGNIYDETMHYTQIGNYANQCIEGLHDYYPYLDVLRFQVMPNHIHLLLRLSEDAPSAVETVFNTVSQNTQIDNTVSQTNTKDKETVCNTVSTRHRSGLSIVIAGMKRAITMFSKENNIDFGWQTRFYDTIIQSANHYSETDYYIQNNVLHWSEDKLNASYAPPANIDP